MKLSDIIKNDSDRLFIVDTECFIIFTGGSINDDRPFIRIGTWADLPVEIIPLVENIIISDKILGNPAMEQFNINVRSLVTNRYIGGESILRRFLDYQRNFGLDLTNVSAVNIEKDLPELPDKKHISDRDQFIGVFYSDGNVKIVHDGRDIFDLNSIYNRNINITEILDRLSKNNRHNQRYSGSGFVISDRNPLFYSEGYFTSYQFPRTYASDFSLLEIDPGKVRELLLPSHNMIYASDILKYKHAKSGKTRIFSDNRDQTELIRKLFKGATTLDEPFSEMNYSTGNGMFITAYGDTPNIRVLWSPETKKEKGLSICFIKSPANIKTILKEPSDAIVISYTAYEQSALLFKSVQKPVMILNDGNRNIRKISDSEHLILQSGIQYDLKSYETADDLKKTLETDEEFNEALNNGSTAAIDSWFENRLSSGCDYFSLANSITLLRVQMNSTRDRKLYSALRELVQKYSRKVSRLRPENFRADSFIEIALCNKSSFPIARKIDRKTNTFFADTYSSDTPGINDLDSDQLQLAERIINDRERLAKILSLFYEDRISHPTFQFMKSELGLLKDEIDSRKEIYNTEYYDTETAERKRKKKGPGVLSFLSDSDDSGTTGLKSYLRNRYGITAAVLIILLLLAAGGLIVKNTFKDNKPVLTEKDIAKETENKNIVVTVKRVDEQEKELLKKHNVRISDYDIFHYANDVAIKNGYSGLTLSGLKMKNPHWIYPSNIFIMLDGEKVVVQKGDTLWDLAHAKLEKMNADFYNIMDRLDSTDPDDTDKIRDILNEAEKFLYTVQQKKFIESYKNKYLKNDR